MRFTNAAVLLSAAVLQYVSADLCTDASFAGDGTNCKYTSFLIDTDPHYLDFPTDAVGTGGPVDGQRAELAQLTYIGTCGGSDSAEILASYDSTHKVIDIKIVNPDCVEPMETFMTKIHAADFITYFGPRFGSLTSPCVARRDPATGAMACIQKCSDNTDYVCYLGVEAHLTLMDLDTSAKVTCNADAKLPNATSIPYQPWIQSLAFSTSPMDRLNLVVRAGHYKSRMAPTITIGTDCPPVAAWSVAPVAVIGVNCTDDWSASFDWSALHTGDCYTGNSPVTVGSDNFQKYDYEVTVVEKDELYIRPLDEADFAFFRTTTTKQTFSLYAQESTEADVTFKAFDYSNVVSIVTSASMSVDSSKGTLVVKVYNSVQDPFMFITPDDTSLAIGDSSSTWTVVNTASGAEDDGGDLDILLTFTVTTDSNGCELDSGTFHFDIKVECNGATAPGDCPIPGDGEETITVTINVPSVDLCGESSSTDLTADLYVYGSQTFENREAFFTEGRSNDYVYVLAVVHSPQLSIPNCDVTAASALMDGGIAPQDTVDLKAGGSANAHWAQVFKDKIGTDLYTSTSIGHHTVPAGACMVMYKFTPVQSLFQVPYDQSKEIALTLTVGVNMPTSKRSISSATAVTSFTLSNPAASSDDADSSNASHFAASLAMTIACALAAVLMF